MYSFHFCYIYTIQLNYEGLHETQIKTISDFIKKALPFKYFRRSKIDNWNENTQYTLVAILKR